MQYIQSITLSLITIFLLNSCQDVRIEEHKEWASFFDDEEVEGAFEYVDNNKERVHYYNKDFNSKQITPGATFTLFESLVALESATAPTEAYTIPWDGKYYIYLNGKTNVITDTTGVNYQKEWAKDLTLSEAFKYNSIPYFQQLTTKITEAEMRHFIDTLKYGNRIYEGDKINFWNNGTLLISPDEHVGILKKLYHSELRGFTERSQRIVKGFFDKISKDNYTLNYKKFTVNHQDTIIIQYLGYVEKIKKLKNPKTNEIDAIPHPYFFVLSVYDPSNSKDLNSISDKIFDRVIKATDLKESFDNF